MISKCSYSSFCQSAVFCSGGQQFKSSKNQNFLNSLVSYKKIETPAAHFIRAQCSIPGVIGSNTAKINIFIINLFVSKQNVETPKAHFVRAQVFSSGGQQFKSSIKHFLYNCSCKSMECSLGEDTGFSSGGTNRARSAR